jgi:hypothetical protein
MSDLYRELAEPIKGLERCPECDEKIIQDIFFREIEKGRRMIEARGCNKCQIIYEVITE